MPRPFRFGVNLLAFRTGTEWRRTCRRAEDLGYDVLHVADHLGMPAPFPALVSAAAATEHIRLGTHVLNAGLWNPALLAREVATCDQLVDGRLELGLGAGYIKAEHDTAGLPFGSPKERVDHLERVVTEVQRSLSDPEHAPQPVQRPVPVLIGGNGDRVLGLAARYARTAAFTGARQTAGGPEGTLELIAPSLLAERVAAYRSFESGRDERAELNMLCQRVAVTTDRRAAVREIAPHAPSLSDDDLLEHPAVLTGSVQQIAGQLRSHRERFGFSSFTVLDAAMETFAPVVEELRGS